MQAELAALFDFQHFWKNMHLELLAEETMKRYGQELPDRKMPWEKLADIELSDDELSFVSAAGEPEIMEDTVNPFRKEAGKDG